jgi:hypothetical protein
MLKSQNAYNYQDLNALQRKAGNNVASSIQQASAKTGVDFSYLLQQAKVESNFKPDAKASTSSATGLYQFIESTWLSMVNEHGDKYGLGAYADKISDNNRVANAADRKEILNLRKDPKIASMMAAEYAKENQDHLKKTVGGDIGSTELYLAHFMGPSGASKFLDAYRENPNGRAASAFPTEARANKNVFFEKDGSARSLKEVYAFFDSKFSIDEPSTVTQMAMLDNEPMPRRPVPSRVDLFDETTGAWVKTSQPKYIEATLALLDSEPQQNFSQNFGGNSSTGFSSLSSSLGQLLSNPIDLLSITEMTDSHIDQERYNV